MEEKKSISEICIDLEGLLRDVEDDQASADHVYHAVYKAMCEAAFKEFPVLKNMSAEQFRSFEDKISRLACDCAVRVADLAYAAEQEKT